MKKKIRLCDLCYEDGKNKTAVASYTAEAIDQKYDVCRRHLDDVKKAKLPFIEW